MRNSSALLCTTFAVLCATLAALCVVLGLASWIVGIYVDEVNGLFTAAGIRWIVAHAMQNFADAPLGKIICALAAIGGIKECGVLSAGRSVLKATVKERRALQITGVAVVLLLALFASLVWMPGHTLLSAFGTFAGSPLQKGWYGIACLFALVVSSVYGYTSGRFARFSDWMQAHTSLLSQSAPYFIVLFLSAQLVAILDYSDLLCLAGHERAILALLRPVLYYIPLLVCVMK